MQRVWERGLCTEFLGQRDKGVLDLSFLYGNIVGATGFKVGLSYFLPVWSTHLPSLTSGSLTFLINMSLHVFECI